MSSCLPSGVAALKAGRHYDKQTRRSQTRANFPMNAIRKEIAQFHDWLLTPNQAGHVLEEITIWIRSAPHVRNWGGNVRDPLDQPRHISLEAAQDAITEWLACTSPPDDYSLEDALGWLNERRGVLQHILHWGNKFQGKHHPHRGIDRSYQHWRRQLASFVAGVSRERLREIESKISVFQSRLSEESKRSTHFEEGVNGQLSFL